MGSDSWVDSWVSHLLGLGIEGLVIGVVVWIVATIITGYFLGVGIWAAMPSEAKQILRPYPGRYPGYDPGVAANLQLRRGIGITFVGAALLIALSFIGFVGGTGHFILGPWLLGGLVPMFVGIAQVVTAMRSGAHFGIPASRTHFDPPPDDVTETTPQEPYAWRPGSAPEIERPAQPPDTR